MAELDYGLLGPLQVRRDGEPRALGAAKQRALLALLLLNANRVVSTDQLIEALWPKKPPGKPQTAVHGYVSQLRKLLEPERKPDEPFRVLVTEAAGYALTLDPEQLDLERFRRLLVQGKQALAADRARQAASTLHEALALFRGPPLAGFTYEPWAQSEIGRIEELRLTALEERIEAELALGKHAELTAELETLVAEQPLRERLRGQLMLALYRSGRQAEALEAYQHARTTLVEELGIDPSPELQTLYKQILNQDQALTVEARAPGPLGNLPAPPNRLIGRVRELQEVEALLGREDARLVTLTGPGGTGKTRLALEVASNLLDSFRDGVYYVPLSAITDPELVVPTIAQTLALRERPGQTVESTFAEHLRDKQLLLLLDNFEQILAAAPSIGSLLTAAAELKVIVTSRTPLHLSSERVYEVPPLDFPDPQERPGLEALLGYEAVALFIERAQGAKAGFSATDEDASVLAEICARLDGLPLAIELAAARITVLPPQALLKRLDQRLMLLTGGARDLPARQQRLRGTIDWSHGLLSEAERKLFARLSVFAGGCRVEAAQAVCDPDRELGIELLDGLAALVEQNLVRQTEDPDGEPRFGMLETIREYARERLRESAEVDEVLPRHAEHVLMLAENVAAKRREREPDWAREIEAEQENLRAALAWLRDSQAGEAYLRLAAAAGLFWSVRGQFREARRWLEEALVATGKEPTRARSEALTQASHVAWRQGDLGRARMLSEESMALAERLGDTRATANAFSHLAALAYSEANYQRARSLWETAAERFAELGELREWATAQSDLALMAIEQGDYARSRDILEQLLTVRHEIGDAVGVGTATTGLGYIALFQEHYADARQLLRDGLRAEYEHQTAEVDIANSLSAVAACLLRSGCIEAGIRVGEATKAFFEEAGAAQEQFLRDLRDDALSDVRGQIDGNEYVDARNAGRAMSIDAAVHYALAVLEPEPAAVPT